ncbi:MAG: rhodanese-like domain-containing protein [Deltaproteobacteria bacterium]|nr:rhodanese-like domain-containing protein [Deltaproteobacteria bacterium]MCW5807574.1 rhodanese-like domain-containing protein [Deltaproteobacteria bacterium]
MVDTLTVTDAAQLLQTSEVDVIDVRDSHEFAAGHVIGARNVPLDALRADPDVALPRRDVALVFVCAKGVRSLTAAKLADRLGYDRVYSLDGGTNAWAQADLPIVSEQRAAA